MVWIQCFFTKKKKIESYIKENDHFHYSFNLTMFFFFWDPELFSALSLFLLLSDLSNDLKGAVCLLTSKSAALDLGGPPSPPPHAFSHPSHPHYTARCADQWSKRQLPLGLDSCC